MATNQELVEKLSLDLGVAIPRDRRPSAKLIWKWQDMDLLPHSSTDTLLGEIYEWSGRTWRTTGNNLIGYLFEGGQLSNVKDELKAVPKAMANVPDFEFTKEDLVKVDFSLPSLFDISIKGDIKNAKEFSIKVNGVTKSRLTNIDQPGMAIMKKLSEFAQDNSKDYRNKLKFDYITTALFYAESVEINLEKDAGVNIELGFAIDNVEVKAQVDTETKKTIKLKYTGNQAPFAATFKKIKNVDE